MTQEVDSINNSGHRKRLRERFTKSEFHGFSDHEIMELFLTLSIPRKDVKGLAKSLLKTFGSICGIFDAPPEELMKVHGVGEATALTFKIVCAMNSTCLQEKFENEDIFDSSDKACRLWKSRLLNLPIEVLEVAYLDTQLRLMKDGIERLESGTVSATAMYPRKIAEAAIRHRSSAIMLAHNHPTGTAMPSDYDERNTRNIKIALQYLGIKLIDHIIVAKNETFSFKENGLL